MAPEQIAIDAAIARHGAMIRRIVATVEANPAIAEELEQEIFVALWRALPSFRGASSLKTFVARIAQYRAITHATTEARRPCVVEVDEGLASDAPGPSAEYEAADTRTRLAAALRTLPHGLREVATLTLEGFDPAEIADTLGITPNACSLRLMRAKAALARILRGDST